MGGNSKMNLITPETSYISENFSKRKTDSFETRFI